jgi:hypothetical protein
LYALCDNGKEHPFEVWLKYKLRAKLKEANMIVRHFHKPLLLYRDIIEENNCAAEEVCLLAENMLLLYFMLMVGLFLPNFST